VEMPLFKGYQVTRFLKSRKNTKPIPVIMFTSLNETKDKFWGTHAGADSYIEKSPENFKVLLDEINKFFSSPSAIDFALIEREGTKMSDDSIIEIVNSLLDNKLFQTTVIGMLAELSDKTFSLEMIARGIFNLLHTVCEADIMSIMIRGSKGSLYSYTANNAQYTAEIADDFVAICVSDFNSHFPDFKVEDKHIENIVRPGDNKKRIVSYIAIPLSIGGDKFATVHIGNSINDYFSPGILENITVFLNAAAPMIANALSMRELMELQKNTRKAFAYYVPADVMDELIDKSSNMVNQSESRNITVLFSDIRSFTQISEHASPQNIVEFLNTYFAAVGNEIISEGGHIDKFIGDSVMAIFGAFQNRENQLVSSVRAGIKMLAAVEAMDASAVSLKKGALKIGIGINSGNCVLGNIGFLNKMDYTVIGDAVNLASRLEGVTKVYRHPLIVSEYIYNSIKNKFLFRKIDNVRVIGKETSVGIYSVYTGFQGTAGNVLRAGEIPDIPIIPTLLINREMLINYNKGLQLFYMREWKPALEYFTKAVEADETDYLAQLYLNRTHEFIATPPPDNWDGVVTLLDK